MALIPDTKAGKVAFYQSKIAPWTTNAVAIGTTAGAVTDLDTKLTAAQDKLAAQVAAAELAKTTTEAADAAVEALNLAGGGIISQIRTKARTSADPASVYELAQIPAPAARTPVNTLGTPSNIGVKLDANGAIVLEWKCNSPRASGVVYQIWRRVSPMDQFTYMGGTGKKNWTDATIPAGSSQVTYQLQAVRSTAAGPWAQVNVNFGAPAGLLPTIKSVTEGKPTKIAA